MKNSYSPNYGEPKYKSQSLVFDRLKVVFDDAIKVLLIHFDLIMNYEFIESSEEVKSIIKKCIDKLPKFIIITNSSIEG